jgi:hypothetical protein
MPKTFLLSIVLPLAGMAVVVLWKGLLKDELTIEDRLAILELLATAVILMVSVWLNDTGTRSPKARAVAAAAAIIVLAGVLPITGRFVKRAYRPDLKAPFTEYEVLWANALGVWVLFWCYFFTHLPG